MTKERERIQHPLGDPPAGWLSHDNTPAERARCSACTAREHVLRAAVYPSQNARCTVCIVCSKLWWTPAPAPPAAYYPRYCEVEWDGQEHVPVGAVLVPEGATA